MRDTKIAKCEGYLEPFNPKLQVGDTQRMFFQPEDMGPFLDDRSRAQKEAS